MRKPGSGHGKSGSKLYVLAAVLCGLSCCLLVSLLSVRDRRMKTGSQICFTWPIHNPKF